MLRRRPNTMPSITSTKMIAIKSQINPGIAKSMMTSLERLDAKPISRITQAPNPITAAGWMGEQRCPVADGVFSLPLAGIPK